MSVSPLISVVIPTLRRPAELERALRSVFAQRGVEGRLTSIVVADNDPAVISALVTAIDDLGEVLFPHLDREVAEAMPVVSRTISDAEWRAIEQEHNIKPKRMTELGFEGHWLIDGIDAEGYEVVTGTVPAIPRFILLHGFARSYRRRMAAVWQPESEAVH